MNIAAGVLIIIAAILNIMGGCTYAVGGALAGGVGEMGSELATGLEEMEAEAGEGGEEGSAKVAEGSEDLKTAGAGLTLWGYALFAIAGIMIAGAVFLFQKSKAVFVIVTGVLAIGAEVGGILITQFGVMNVCGLVAGVLAILAARSFPTSASG